MVHGSSHADKAHRPPFFVLERHPTTEMYEHGGCERISKGEGKKTKAERGTSCARQRRMALDGVGGLHKKIAQKENEK
jgi:hypothetical protein